MCQFIAVGILLKKEVALHKCYMVYLLYFQLIQQLIVGLELLHLVKVTLISHCNADCVQKKC